MQNFYYLKVLAFDYGLIIAIPDNYFNISTCQAYADGYKQNEREMERLEH